MHKAIRKILETRITYECGEQMPEPTITNRFFNGFVRETNGCWMWIKHKGNGRYGTLSINGKSQQAHRVSWELHNGPIPQGKRVLHKCDKPSCVNPDHLFLGTLSENTLDMMRKGRCPLQKLTPDDVRAIRRDPRRNCQVAIEYNVAPNTISYVRAHKTFAWVD